MVSGWVEKSVAEIAPLQRGFDLPSSRIERGEFPVVYSNGVGEKHRYAMVKGPGVVTGRSGTIGRLTYLEQDYYPHNTTLWVTGFHGNDEKFIYYLYHLIDWKRLATGSGVPTLNRNDVHELRLMLPVDKAEQSAIAKVLTEADEYVAALEKLIAKKRMVKQGAMQELLTGKRRLPGFEEEWVMRKLGDTLKIGHGRSQREIESAAGRYPILATSGEIGRSDVYLYDKPSVLIGRKGTIDKPQYRDTPFWTIDTLFYTMINADCCPRYLFYLVCTIDWCQKSEASGVPSLSASIIENIDAILPATLAEQAAIAAVLSDMDAEIDALTAKLEKARRIRQGMMSELLTGRIRLLKEDTSNGEN